MSRATSAIAETIVERVANFAADRYVPEVLTLVRTGRPDKCIIDVANQYEVDLIVIGSRGREGFDSLLHPSVAEFGRKQTACPCLVLFPAVES